MVAAGAEAGVVRQGVVDPPDARGHEVGEDHVDGVVAAGDQEEDDPAQRHDEGGPVEQLETPRRVCGEKNKLFTATCSMSPPLTLLYCKIAHGKCHGVAGEYVVSAVNVLAIDRQSTAAGNRYHSSDVIWTKHNNSKTVMEIENTKSQQWKVLKLTHDRGLVTGRLALVRVVSFGKHSHEEGHGPVVVEDAEQQPDAAEDDQAVLVETHDSDGGQGGDHQQVLAHIQPPPLELDVVQDYVG